MHTVLSLDDKAITATAPCNLCGTAVTLFSLEIPMPVKFLMMGAGFDLTEAMGNVEFDRTAAVFCSECVESGE